VKVWKSVEKEAQSKAMQNQYEQMYQQSK